MSNTCINPPKQRKLLSPWPVLESKQYLVHLNSPQAKSEEEALERSLTKNIPYGTDSWRDAMIETYNLAQTMRGVGRPKNILEYRFKDNIVPVPIYIYIQWVLGIIYY